MNQSVPVVYHYVGWAVSMPLQVLALFFFASLYGKLGMGLFWRLVVVSILMVFVRYLGEAGFMHATLAFLIGLVFWLYILGELFFGRMDEAVRGSVFAARAAKDHVEETGDARLGAALQEGLARVGVDREGELR